MREMGANVWCDAGNKILRILKGNGMRLPSIYAG